MTENIPVVTIDGPSGVGKGTLSRMLANHLKWHYLDSGAIYRALAIAAINHNIGFDNKQSLSLLAEHLDIKFKNNKLILEGEDITDQIRLPKCSKYASQIASLDYIREKLIQRQRKFRKLPGLIADGRDMGTVIFKHATVKLYIVADVNVRAERREKQLIEQNIKVSYNQVLEEMKKRDESDINRKYAPLVPASDAIILDNTNKSIEDCFRFCLSKIQTVTLD